MRNSLLRSTLGLGFGVAVAVGSMIGAGILRAPADVAARLPIPALFLGAWVAGGLYALLGANALAELGAMLPKSGGQYVYVRHALGPFAGFLVGWNDWMSTCGSVAAVALVAGEALGVLVPLLSHQTVVMASVVIALTTIVLYRGVRESDRTQQLTSALKAAALLALVLACLQARARGVTIPASATAPPIAVPVGVALAVAFITALQGIIYAYDGWTGILYFSEEVRDVGREIPRSLFYGVASVIALYLLLNIAFLSVLPLPLLASSPLAAASAATAVFGPRGGTLVQLLVVIVLPSAIVANTLMASRVLYALGRDGAAPRLLSAVNAGGTPGPALLASSVVGVLFVMTGAFEKVITICSFLFVASYSVSFASLFVLRSREPGAVRPFRAWAHPWSTGAMLIGSIVFLAGTIVADPRTGMIALALVIASYPAYRLFLRTAPG